MIKLNIHEAKTQLSKYLKLLKKGEKIIICRRHVPVAEIRAVGKKQPARRAIGLAKGLFTVPDSFFDPLPDDFVRSFEEQTE